MGYLGNQWCFMGVTKEEAISKFKEKENYTDDDLKGLEMIEGYIIDGCFWNYEVGFEEEKTTKL